MMILLKVWIIYAICGVVVYSMVFLWAVRNRQFSELDRQRYIALDDTVFSDDEGINYTKAGLADRYTWIALMVMTLLMLVTVVILSVIAGKGV